MILFLSMEEGDYYITKSFLEAARRLFVLDEGELMEYDSEGMLIGGGSGNLKPKGKLIGSLSSIEVIRLISKCQNVKKGDFKDDFIVPCDEIGHGVFGYNPFIKADERLITKNLDCYHFLPGLWQVWSKEKNLIRYSHSLDVRMRRGQNPEMPDILLSYLKTV
ncbi:unnamed protein product [marine sediment metagenome]|uniref:Uncharacterized protein n=1 Tax=marine sediment metagenome TaxID=412755 RepID=X0WHF0_9ZZZZ